MTNVSQLDCVLRETERQREGKRQGRAWVGGWRAQIEWPSCISECTRVPAAPWRRMRGSQAQGARLGQRCGALQSHWVHPSTSRACQAHPRPEQEVKTCQPVTVLTTIYATTRSTPSFCLDYLIILILVAIPIVITINSVACTLAGDACSARPSHTRRMSGTVCCAVRCTRR